ncbi:MAG: imidazole glycerol phosphate synthase subunit HisH [Candidatus Omnitrophota bacterium]|nr:imidazole glycerol phosphate synthase subunit HisH [Candidatus Omnitrophota bacterium]
MIAIIDYGMGNIHSIKKALENCGAKTLVTNKAQDIRKCNKVVLPGVGAFADAMHELRKRGLVVALREHITDQKIFLGICLGMQLLFQESEEAPDVKGLGLLKGSVIKFKARPKYPVPQIGWNQLKIKLKVKSQKSKECPLLKDIPNGAYVYFCHSYYPLPADKKVNAASCAYGVNFAAVAWKDNIYGTQFHPEKSQEIGMQMLKNFVNL